MLTAFWGREMQRQNTAIVTARRRQSVMFGRRAAWLGFASAVCSQAAILAAVYFLADPAAPFAWRNAAVAGAGALLGLGTTIAMRRIGKRAQTSIVNLGRVPLRLVVDTRPEVEGNYHRPAA
jgi:hypothetical protein